MAIKYCMMPNCWNNSSCTPNKLFIRIPVDFQTKENWFKAMNVSPSPSIKNTCQFCCEDHFDLMNDAENFIEFKLIGCRLRMKKSVVPHLNININDKTAEESQFTLSAQQIRNTNIETLQQCTYPPPEKKVKFKTSSSFPMSSSMYISSAYLEPEIDFNINEDSGNVLLSLVKQESEENFANYITVKKEFITFEDSADQEKTNETLLLVKQETDESIEDGVTIKKEYIAPEDEQMNKQKTNQLFNIEEINDEQLVKQKTDLDTNKDIFLTVVKQETDESIEDGVTIKKEYISPEDKQLEKQKTDQHFNIEEINKTVCLSLVKQETNENYEDGVTINEEFIASKDCVNKDEQLVKQKTDLDFKSKETNKDIFLTVVKQEIDDNFEDEATINEEFIIPDSYINEDKQLLNQKKDLDFNSNEENKNEFLSMVQQEINENLKDGVTINEEIIEDCVAQDEQLIKPETVSDFNKNILLSSLKQEAEENFENNVTIEEFIASEECIDQNEQLINQEIDQNEEIQENFEDNITIKEECIAPEDYVQQEFYQELETHELLLNITNEHNYYGENKNINVDIAEEIEPIVDEEMSTECHVEELKSGEEECGPNISIQDVIGNQVLKCKPKLKNRKEPKRYECSICKKYLPSRSNLRCHLTVHTGIKDLKCTICSKQFIHKSDFQEHVYKTHVKVKKVVQRYACSYCNKMYPRQQLESHIKITHLGIKNYECNVCNKKFKHMYALNQHMDKHNGVKIQCLKCNKMIARYSIKYHETKCTVTNFEI